MALIETDSSHMIYNKFVPKFTICHFLKKKKINKGHVELMKGKPTCPCFWDERYFRELTSYTCT